jgi:RHS repeat-associated protein
LGTNGYSVWIGGIYEINNGKVLCHVMAGGKRIATFEPVCGSGWSSVFGEKHWYAASTALQSALDWPFQKGRGPMTTFFGTWAAVFGVSFAAGRRVRLKRFEIRRALRPTSLWKQAVTLVSISAFIVSTTGNAEAATYSPVFYYYHANNLGSSNVLTDRSGNLVQHYEYATFGQTTYQNNASAFPVSNRYTGQICDDETGLYYYGARYYDPQLGRFIQPDSSVPSDDPQTLNRYAYCGNNPLKYVDPTGHILGIDDILIAILVAAVGAAVGAVSAAITGGNIGKGALTGAISAVGILSGGILGGAAAGAINAEITGGDPGIGAIMGGISAGIGFAVGSIQLPDNAVGSLAGLALNSGQGALVGGVQAEIQGGSFGQGAEKGAIGGAINDAMTGRTLPLIGGMLGGVRDIMMGGINTALGIATLGQSGTLISGLNQIGEGIGTEVDIIARDTAAAFAGIVGKAYITLRDTANLLTLGQVKSLGTEFAGVSNKPSGLFGAVTRFFGDAPVPCYGNFNGSNWGVPNFGYHTELEINHQDAVAYEHDLRLYDLQWIEGGYNIHPTEGQWVGPVGAAFVLFGTTPFAVISIFQKNPYVNGIPSQ